MFATFRAGSIDRDSGHKTVPVRKYVEEEEVDEEEEEDDEEETVVTDVCVTVKNLRCRVGGSTEELDSTIWMHLDDSTMRASPGSHERHR